MSSTAQKWLLRAAPWFLPVGIVLVWQLASSTGWLSSRILPSPEGVVEAFWSLSASGELWQHLAISSWRAVIGFSIGGSIGLTLGLISGLSRWGERLLDTSVQMLRNVPHLALIPLVILWFGIDESAKIFLVALGTLFPIYINTWHGIRNIDRGLVEMAQLWPVRFCPVYPCDPAGRPALHYGWGAFCARPDVANPDRGGNHFGQLRHWLSGDERPRVPANGRGGGCHYPLCPAWQTCGRQRPVAGT